MERISYYDHYNLIERATLKEVQEAKAIVMCDVGEVLREDSLFVWISPNTVEFGTDEVQFDNVHCIVKGAIIDRVRL